MNVTSSDAGFTSTSPRSLLTLYYDACVQLDCMNLIEAANRGELDASGDSKAPFEEMRAYVDAVRPPFRTAERFIIEEIIDPGETRPLLSEWVHDAYALLPEQLGRPGHGTRS